MTPHEHGEDDDGELRPGPRATLCTACSGRGAVIRFFAAVAQDEPPSTASVPIPCTFCDGSGRLDGFYVPM